MANGQNGGRWALAGFLYQIVGMVSMVARASEPADLSPDDGDIRVDSLLMLPNASVRVHAYHERFEDVAFMDEDGNKCVLVQFKYSGSGRKIGVGEAREITRKLNDSVEAAEVEGYEVTACVLFTNRRLTSKGGRAAKQHWESENREHDYALHYCKSPPVGKLRRDLSEFGRKYGLFNHEIEEGIQSLIGRVFLQTGDLFNRPFNQSDLKQCFIGSRSAQRLTVNRIRQQPNLPLQEFGERIGINQLRERPIQRTALRELFNAIHQERALIGLFGPGGCGKSTLMWQVLTNLPPDRCCIFIRAEAVNRRWIQNKIHGWRGLRDDVQYSRRVAIERILIANPDSQRPVIWLGMDGIDEGHLSPEREDDIREILDWFWQKDRNHMIEKPPATLIVSARKKEDIHRLLPLPGGPLQPPRLPLTLEVTAFTEQERDRAAMRLAPQIYQIVHRFSAQNDLQEIGKDTVVLGAEIENDYMDSSIQFVWDALQHPAMWQALLSMNSETQESVIAGDQDAQNQLAHKFLLWVGYKIELRCSEDFQDLTRHPYHELLEIFSVIAQHSVIGKLHRRDSDWVVPAGQTRIRISCREAEILYRESLSAGLIDENSPRLWRWRHSLVYDYLMNYRRGE